MQIAEKRSVETACATLYVNLNNAYRRVKTQRVCTVRAFLMAYVHCAPLCPATIPLILPSCHFKPLLSKKATPAFARELVLVPIPALPPYAGTRCRNPANYPAARRAPRLLRLALGLRSSSGCKADNRRFDYLLVPTPANYSRAR